MCSRSFFCVSCQDVDPELEQALEQDFELGEIFKSRLIKHAVDWFTGKALEYEDQDEEVRGFRGAITVLYLASVSTNAARHISHRSCETARSTMTTTRTRTTRATTTRMTTRTRTRTRTTTPRRRVAALAVAVALPAVRAAPRALASRWAARYGPRCLRF